MLKVGGRTFPVSVHYERAGQAGDSSQRIRTYQKLAEQKAIALHRKLPDTDLSKRHNHDILIFLSEGGEVEQLARALSARLKDCLCVPLHGGLDKDEQRRAFKPADPAQGQRRKIVVATNIAETSVTFDGIGAVIDPGFSKQARYDATKDATVLRISSISQSSARQRAGRAGRTAPGECHRLYTEEEV